MTRTGIRLITDTFVDSVRQLAGTRAMSAQPGVEWAAVAMATPANIDTLRAEGFPDRELSTAHANDLVLAVRAVNEQAVDAALQAGYAALFAATAASTEEHNTAARTLERAVARQPGTTVAVISVPGEYAALEAHKALTAGLDVLLFSDNVPIEQEIELKDRAMALGRLMMGPGAGTALLAGTGLGFANVVRPGPVGVVAAAGTGAQEVMSLLDRWGSGISAVVGVGGRDLTDTVDGRMARQAVAALRADETTQVILLVAKAPSPRVARAVMAEAFGKPMVAALIGMHGDVDLPVTRTLEAGALATLDLLGLPRPNLVGDLPAQIDEAIRRLGSGRHAVRGLFSGGTLCYESQVILADVFSRVYSNAPLDQTMRLPYPKGASVCLDLGEEEYTRGRPHPMIDPETRVAILREHGHDESVAVILLDVVLGYGAHADPAGALAPVCEEITREGGPRIVAYCLGTDQDPQNLQSQRQRLRDAGCIVTETAARASFAAAAIATRGAVDVQTVL